MEIGGFFPYEESMETETNYALRMCPSATDMKHLMSGRCAIYYCLQDSMLTDQKRVAYLPSYTCETVTGCFVKANYEIYYYDVDEHLVPQFDETLIDKISFLLITGYYGFSTFDPEFVRKCRRHGVTVMQDTTHTALSPSGCFSDVDYVAVSLRKWMGVISGGLAFKCGGTFHINPLPADEHHLSVRDYALSARHEYEHNNDEELNKKSLDAFWEAEWELRKIYDIQEGDPKSLETILHYPIDNAIEKRRKNFAYLLKHLPKNPEVRPIFTELPDDVCPMFFPFLVDNRNSLMEHLAVNEVPPKIYWPVPPFIDITGYPKAEYVYGHIMSICCDQRFSEEEMKKVVAVFEDYKK